MLVRTATGRTDVNGFVALNCYISWEYDPDLIDMMVYVSDWVKIFNKKYFQGCGITSYPPELLLAVL